MRCGGCGTELLSGATFCLHCGRPQQVSCAQCGSALRDGARFCSECGTPTVADGAPASESKADASAARVAPAAVPRTERVSERRLCSLLFADLVGFTRLSEARDPEEVREPPSRYFEAVRTVVERDGGVVEKFRADAVTAVWGTPMATEVDAERAVRAGLELADAVGVLGAQSAVAEATEIAERLHAAPLGEADGRLIEPTMEAGHG